MFENRVLRRILGPKRDRVTWEGRTLHNWFMICNNANYYFGDQSKKNELSLACNTEGARRRLHTGFWWGNQLEELCMDGTVLLNWMFNKSVTIS